MRQADSAPSAAKGVAVLGFGLLALVASGAGTAANTPDASNYTWSAELVSFDRANNTATVKARLVPHADADLETLRAGERAMLTWSGISTAAGVRAVERGTRSSYDRMTLPIEFVGTELDGNYVVFEVPVPAADADKIAALEPGQWVTATSPHQPSGPSEAVLSMRPYNDAR